MITRERVLWIIIVIVIGVFIASALTAHSVDQKAPANNDGTLASGYLFGMPSIRGMSSDLVPGEHYTYALTADAGPGVMKNISHDNVTHWYWLLGAYDAQGVSPSNVDWNYSIQTSSASFDQGVRWTQVNGTAINGLGNAVPVAIAYQGSLPPTSSADLNATMNGTAGFQVTKGLSMSFTVVSMEGSNITPVSPTLYLDAGSSSTSGAGTPPLPSTPTSNTSSTPTNGGATSPTKESAPSSNGSATTTQPNVTPNNGGTTAGGKGSTGASTTPSGNTNPTGGTDGSGNAATGSGSSNPSHGSKPTTPPVVNNSTAPFGGSGQPTGTTTNSSGPNKSI